MADESYRMRFIPNSANIKRLGRTEEMLVYMGFRAESAAAAAQAIAPVATGAYRDSIEAQAGFAENLAIGRVVAKDFKAGWIEFGTYKWPAHATLRLGAESSGLHVRGGRRMRWRPKKSGGWY